MSAVLIVCGLNREASLAAGPDIMTIAGGGASGALAAQLDGLDRRSISAVISFGLAGALTPDLPVGRLVLASAVVPIDGAAVGTSVEIRASWAATLRSGGLAVADGQILGVDRPILSPREKAVLASRSSTVAVDMESHIAAAYAKRYALPFAILRVISDASDQALPELVGRAMRPDGSVDVWAVLRGLARRPGDLPDLLTTARDAGRAFRVLGRARRLLGPRLGLRGVDLR